MAEEPTLHRMDDPARWSDTASDYLRWAEPFTAQFAREALKLSGGAGPAERVLDVAAGTGALALAAAEVGASVLATDFSPGMVSVLADRLAAFDGCEARVMDGQALAIDDGAFDAAFSIFGVFLFPDWRRGLAELVRVTRPGGRVTMATWTEPTGNGPWLPFLQAYRIAFPDEPIPPPPEGASLLSSSDRLHAKMITAGCREVQVHAVDGAWNGPFVDQAIDGMDDLFRSMPLYAALDADRRAHLRPHLRAALTRYATADGLRVPATALIAIGEKPAS